MRIHQLLLALTATTSLAACAPGASGGGNRGGSGSQDTFTRVEAADICVQDGTPVADCAAGLTCMPEDTSYDVYRCVDVSAVPCNDDDSQCAPGQACGKSYDDTTYACVARAHVGGDADPCNVPDSMGGTVVCDNDGGWYCLPDTAAAGAEARCNSIDDLVECKTDADCAALDRVCVHALDSGSDVAASFCLDRG